MGQATLHGLRKRYGAIEVTRCIDLNVRDGGFMVFAGPSGYGKPTTLSMFAGLESITGGDPLIDGKRANDLRPAERGAAMVFQSNALYPRMTVAESRGFSLKMSGVSRAQRDEQVARTIDILGTTELFVRLPKDQSGGRRQRVVIGRETVRKPKVYLYGEPRSNVDAALRVNMRIELSRLHKELGSTKIYVRPDRGEAMTMGDRITVFNKDVVQQFGAPLDLYNRPANGFVATFLGAPFINLVDRPFEASAQTHRNLWATLMSGAIPSVMRLGIRPEHLQVVPVGEGIAATVALVANLGGSSIFQLQVEGVSEALHAKVGSDNSQRMASQTVGLALDTKWTMALDASGRSIH